MLQVGALGHQLSMRVKDTCLVVSQVIEWTLESIFSITMNVGALETCYKEQNLGIVKGIEDAKVHRAHFVEIV